MPITSISRDWGYAPSIVRISTTDTLATITTTGYIETQDVYMLALNAGDFEWALTDYVLVYYSDNGGSWGFFTYVPATFSLVAAPVVPGSLSNTLPNADIFVGNAANVATGVAMSGDATIANTGAVTIAAHAVTSAKLATNLIQYTEVNLTAAQFLGMYAAPVTVLPVAGANAMYIIYNMTLQYNYGTVQLAVGGNIGLQYGTAVNLAGPLATSVLAAATINADVASSVNQLDGVITNVALASTVNAAISISNDTAAFTTGDGTYRVNIWYSIMPTV